MNVTTVVAKSINDLNERSDLYVAPCMLIRVPEAEGSMNRSMTNPRGMATANV